MLTRTITAAVLFGVIGVAGGAALTAIVPHQWRAETPVIVGIAAGTERRASDLALMDLQADRLVALAQDDAVLENAGSSVDRPPRKQGFGDEVRSTVDDRGVVIEVTLHDRAAAAQVADTVAERIAALLGDDADTPSPTVVAVGRGTTSAADALPRGLWPWIGALVGTIAGVLLLLVEHRRRHTLRGLVALDEAAGAPALDAGHSDVWPALARMLGAHRVFGLSAPTAAVDLTHTTIELALSIAAKGRSVALVDGDLAHGRLSRATGATSGPGLSDALAGRINVLDAVRSWECDGQRLAVVPAGDVPAGPGALLRSPRMSAALDLLREEADVVIVQLPPALDGPEALLLGAHAGVVVLVARSGVSRSSEVESAARGFRSFGVTVRAALLVEARRRTERTGRWFGRGADLPALGRVVEPGRRAVLHLLRGRGRGSVKAALMWPGVLRASWSAGRTRAFEILPAGRRAVGRIIGAMPRTPSASAAEPREIDLLALTSLPWDPDGDAAPASTAIELWTPQPSRLSRARTPVLRLRVLWRTALKKLSEVPRRRRHVAQPEPEPLVLVARVGLWSAAELGREDHRADVP